MSKDKIEKPVDNSKAPAERNLSYTGEKKTNTNTSVGSSSKKVSVMFRENRKYDLHIGRNMITFLARETKEIPAEWLNHKDWKNVESNFVVKGV